MQKQKSKFVMLPIAALRLLPELVRRPTLFGVLMFLVDRRDWKTQETGAAASDICEATGIANEHSVVEAQRQLERMEILIPVRRGRPGRGNYPIWKIRYEEGGPTLFDGADDDINDVPGNQIKDAVNAPFKAVKKTCTQPAQKVQSASVKDALNPNKRCTQLGANKEFRSFSESRESDSDAARPDATRPAEPEAQRPTPGVDLTPTTSPTADANPKPLQEESAAPTGDNAKPERSPKPRLPKSEPTGTHQRVVKHFCEGWKRKYAAAYPFCGKDGSHVKWMLGQLLNDGDELLRIIDAYLANDEEFLRNDRHGLGLLKAQFRKYIAKPSGSLNHEQPNGIRYDGRQFVGTTRPPPVAPRRTGS